MTPGGFGPEAFQAETGVSRETMDRLLRFDALLLDWSGRMNLVGRASLEDRWRRHFWDSAQLAPLMPAAAKIHADIGSGAGFPGLVLAALRAEEGAGETHLFESTAKKCAFLREGAEAMGVAAMVRNERVEHIKDPLNADVVTARAVAPLAKLLALAAPLGHKDTAYLFPKGRDVDVELTEAAKSWSMTVNFHRSQTSPEGVVLELRDLRRV